MSAIAVVAAVVATSASGVTGGDKITTIAGNGCCASSGYGGPAKKAGLAGVNGVAVDGQGNVYLVENTGRRVRKVSRRGKITAFAGTGKCCYSGDGRAASARLTNPYGVAADRQGNVYIADLGVEPRAQGEPRRDDVQRSPGTACSVSQGTAVRQPRLSCGSRGG